VVVALGYMVLIGYFAEWLETSSRGVLHKWQVAVYGLLILLPLWNTIPLLTGDIHAIFVPVVQRDEYTVLNAFISAQPEFSRVVLVPGSSQWFAISPLHPKLPVAELSSLRLDAAPTGDESDNDANWKSEMFTRPQTQGVLDLLSVRYVVVPLSNKQNHDDIFEEKETLRKKMLADLDSSPFLKRKDIGSGDLALYVNETARPYAWTTTVPETISAPAPYVPVADRDIDVSRHELIIKGVSGPVFLHISSSFHPGWSLFERLPSRWEQLSFVDRSVAGVTHERDVTGTNVYRIDPSKACETFVCTPNPDGSVNIHAVLFFTPQAYFDLGSVITALGLLGCLGTLVVLTWRKKRGEKV